MKGTDRSRAKQTKVIADDVAKQRGVWLLVQVASAPSPRFIEGAQVVLLAEALPHNIELDP